MVIIANQLNQLCTVVYRVRLNPLNNHFYRLEPILSSDFTLMLCNRMQSSEFFGKLLLAKTERVAFELAGANLTNQGSLNV